MAIRVKSIESLRKKYETNASASTGAYEEGVKFPRRSQSESAATAEPTYEAAVLEAIAEKRFSAGVREAGDKKWQDGAIEKGKGRLAGGIKAGASDWADNTKPIIDAMAAVNLPPRGVKGDPQNLERVRMMNEAARAASR